MLRLLLVPVLRGRCCQVELARACEGLARWQGHGIPEEVASLEREDKLECGIQHCDSHSCSVNLAN